MIDWLVEKLVIVTCFFMSIQPLLIGETTMNEIALIVAALIFLILCFLLVSSYLENKRMWNAGICKENGLPWTVEETDGTLWLQTTGRGIDRKTYRCGGLVPGAIVKAYRARQERVVV